MIRATKGESYQIIDHTVPSHTVFQQTKNIVTRCLSSVNVIYGHFPYLLGTLCTLLTPNLFLYGHCVGHF